ncbi:insulin-like growth factor-binding protein complex acid labile subunit [Branchiostoma floridae]|uniref:Insulin-like growth factor-binding protein complex acid labile subunit n=1 Tax=Branchiostoma floridae TaxID=7739 RepID=A0A9J7MVM3_BRAFL|nr:insulin-like growth factor-binding protein complex acid labile subunit [Branchiostoma floridae]
MLRKGDFVDLPDLKRLQIWWNLNLTTVEVGTFDNLPTVTELLVFNNSVAMFPPGMLRGLDQLTRFDGNHNHLVMVPSGLFTNHSTLQFIDLSWNNISSLEPGSLVGLQNLATLELHNNKLGSLTMAALSGVPKLQYLDCSFNSITNIEKGIFSGLKDLNSVAFDNNKVTEVDGLLHNHPKLVRITLPNNHITNIHNGTFAQLPSLSYLDISNNKISVLESGAFVEFDALQYLLLANNGIHEMTLAGLSSLIELDLGDNHLGSFPTKMADAGKQLQTLTLNNNPINEPLHAGQFSVLRRLSNLNLNNITSIRRAGTLQDPKALCGCDALDKISLNHNNISTLPIDVFACTPTLSYLYLSYNELTEVPPGLFTGMRQLYSLDLSHNRLSRLQPKSFDGFEKMTFLDMGGNNFTNVDHVIPAFTGPSSRYFPALYENKIVYLGPDSFPGVTSTTFLNFAGNRIRIIEEGAFSPASFSNLTEVMLDQGNLLHFLPGKIAEGLPKLLSLAIDGCPFQCDCQLRDLAAWVQSRKPHSYPYVDVFCASPPKLNGKYLSDIPLSELTCDCDHEQAPSIDTSGSDDHVQEGQSAMLNCRVTGCPLAELFWTTPGGDMLAVGWGFPRMEVIDIENSGTLSIQRATVGDTGDYVCTAVNYRGKTTKTVHLQVDRKP